MAIPPQRLQHHVPRNRRLRLRILALRLELEEEEHRHAAVLARLIQARQQLRQGRRQRRWWVRPWIQRRRLFGQYDTLFQELERESQGDYVGYIRMDRDLFVELLDRVTPRITKGPRLVLPVLLHFCCCVLTFCTVIYLFVITVHFHTTWQQYNANAFLYSCIYAEADAPWTRD